MDLEQHLRNRHVVLELHRPVLDHREQVATFLLWNLSGQLCGYQQYRPGAPKTQKNNPREGRYFTRPSFSTVSVWGVESLHFTPRVVFVTEGIFDAARLTEQGASAVAVLSNNPSTSVYNWLHSLGRTVVAVCDSDAAGRRLARLGHHAVFTQDKDLGDSDQQFVDQLLDRYLTV